MRIPLKQLVIPALFLGFTLSVPAATLAQAGPEATQSTQAYQRHCTPAHKAEFQVRKLAEALALSPDQVAQIKPILLERQEKVASLHNGPQLTPQQKHEQRRAINLEARTKLQSVLTPEQQRQFAQMVTAHRHHGDQGSAPSV